MKLSADQIIQLIQEVQYKTSRSGGKGGQHVNKVETKVELLFDIDSSQVLNPEQKALLKNFFHVQISQEGVLRIIAQKEKSQFRNKQLVTEKFIIAVQKALTPVVKRIKTNVPANIKLERLLHKKLRSEKKLLRKKPNL